MARKDGRGPDELRPVSFELDYVKWPEGSVLVSFGDTRVLVNATFEDRVPGWMRGKERGWVTAEYDMLPRATDTRNQRDARKGKVGGRTHEISRLIGRSLRAAVDLQKLGERSVTLDCDVIQADGGTRTAAVTGGYVALKLATQKMLKAGVLKVDPVVGQIAAVSVGIVGGEVMLDLKAEEDQRADTDLNLVHRCDGGIIEIQGTAEKAPFSGAELDQMVGLGAKGIEQLFEAQREALGA